MKRQRLSLERSVVFSTFYVDFFTVLAPNQLLSPLLSIENKRITFKLLIYEYEAVNALFLCNN